MESVEELGLVGGQFYTQSLALYPLRQCLVQLLHVTEPFPGEDARQGCRIVNWKNDGCDAIDGELALVQLRVGHRKAVDPGRGHCVRVDGLDDEQFTFQFVCLLFSGDEI